MSDSPTPATLEFLASQQAKIISGLADQRADTTVLLAIVQRMDGTMQGLLGELRAPDGQISHFGNRLQRAEEKLAQ